MARLRSALTSYLTNKLSDSVWFIFKPDLVENGLQYDLKFVLYLFSELYNPPKIFLFVSVFVKRRKSLSKVVKLKHQSLHFLLDFVISSAYIISSVSCPFVFIFGVFVSQHINNFCTVTLRAFKFPERLAHHESCAALAQSLASTESVFILHFCVAEM